MTVKILIMNIKFEMSHVYSCYIVHSTKKKKERKNTVNILPLFKSFYSAGNKNADEQVTQRGTHSAEAGRGFTLMNIICMRVRNSLTEEHILI